MLYVAADNSAAHSLAGFLESFVVDRFCMALRNDIQEKEVLYVQAHLNPELRTLTTNMCRRYYRIPC